MNTSTPHTRSIGSTLHHVFVLPMPANVGNTKSRVRKTSKRAKPTVTKGTGATKRKSAARALKTKLTGEQERELGRVRAAEERQRRKELGLCRDCKNPPYPAKPAAQTAPRSTISDNAEKHRTGKRNFLGDAKRPSGMTGPVLYWYIRLLPAGGSVRRSGRCTAVAEHRGTPCSAYLRYRTVVPRFHQTQTIFDQTCPCELASRHTPSKADTE